MSWLRPDMSVTLFGGFSLLDEKFHIWYIAFICYINCSCENWSDDDKCWWSNTFFAIERLSLFFAYNKMFHYATLTYYDVSEKALLEVINLKDWNEVF